MPPAPQPPPPLTPSPHGVVVLTPRHPLSPPAGINMVKRKLAAHDNLKLTITQEGNKFTVKESSTFRTTEIVFELGVAFNYSLADGTELSVSTFHTQCTPGFLRSAVKVVSAVCGGWLGQCGSPPPVSLPTAYIAPAGSAFQCFYFHPHL